MNTKTLDRLLCERLNIEPIEAPRHVYHDHAGNFIDCACGAVWRDNVPRAEQCPARSPIYPTLSTTGDGMVTLMEALRNKELACMVGQREGTHYDGAVGGYPVDDAASWAQASAAPLALALAAVKALGIEVPE